MNKYRVVALVQSEGNDPVELRWLRGGDGVEAMISVGQILDEQAHQPFGGYSTKLISISVTPVPDPNDEAPWKV